MRGRADRDLQSICPGDAGFRHPQRVAVALPDQQLGATLAARAEHPLPHVGHVICGSRDRQHGPALGVGAGQDQDARWLDCGYPEAGRLGRGEEDQLTGVQFLQLRDDPMSRPTAGSL
jgi:hypothetical protein